MNSVPQYSVKKTIRVRKQDSVFIYNIFESHEGITSYSTLDFSNGDLYRDLELRIPPDYLIEVDEILKQLGDLVYEIRSE